jgi:thiosulfate/3-mercaptopyruvate sulfurtransferase
MSLHTNTPYLTALLASLALLSGCHPHAEDIQATNADKTGNQIDSLVSVEWLMNNLEDPNLVILDASVMIESDGDGGFRTVNGRGNFEAGHIPTAGFADLKGDLVDGDADIGYAIPEPEQFAAAMGALGVGDDSKVVIYDAGGSMWAARVWWMLRWVGFDNAALLDGGQAAWTNAGYSLSTVPPTRAAKTLTVNLRPELIVDKNEVLAAIDDESVNIVDALPEAHYRGDYAMYARPGHIPTATNVSVADLADESGHYKSMDELDAMFDGDRDARTITYCGGGIAASGNAFIMHRLGFKDVALYSASLQEWSVDPELPMVTGSTPTGE